MSDPLMCPTHPNEELVFEAYIAAPGYGRSYSCPQGHSIIDAGGLFDPADEPHDQPPRNELTIEDVR